MDNMYNIDQEYIEEAKEQLLDFIGFYKNDLTPDQLEIFNDIISNLSVENKEVARQIDKLAEQIIGVNEGEASAWLWDILTLIDLDYGY